jgi:hypothetical protein
MYFGLFSLNFVSRIHRSVSLTIFNTSSVKAYPTVFGILTFGKSLERRRELVSQDPAVAAWRNDSERK